MRTIVRIDIRWEALTVDASDPLELARWWARTLGWEVVDPFPAGVEVRPSDGRAPSLFFVEVDDARHGKNRLHLDLYAEDQPAAVSELLARGATRADVGQPADAACVVMRDPEGNGFCLLDPR
ncbi:VOC family protein [Spiractinospora alimapuensis]|uniref:VOC family protein n=1 Tax=Spiractinospora alimapuensis TaxID=2820884 RepID=UPI001F37327F|nr:VOC family protein [Spiractinospora alimapuensis]QVQ52844.1 VOC family protein [Spiractinospora alimapuensis]